MTHKIDPDLLSTNPTLQTSLNSVIIIDSNLLYNNGLPHLEICTCQTAMARDLSTCHDLYMAWCDGHLVTSLVVLHVHKTKL